jgi:hypothetical protein
VKWRKRRPEQEAVQEVKEAAAPHVALLRRLQEEQRRIDAQIEREIGLYRNV